MTKLVSVLLRFSAFELDTAPKRNLCKPHAQRTGKGFGRSLKHSNCDDDDDGWLKVALHSVPCVCVSLRYILLLGLTLCSMVINEQPSTTAAGAFLVNLVPYLNSSCSEPRSQAPHTHTHSGVPHTYVYMYIPSPSLGDTRKVCVILCSAWRITFNLSPAPLSKTQANC